MCFQSFVSGYGEEINLTSCILKFLPRNVYTDECFWMSLRQNKEADFNNEQNNNFVIK